MYVEIIDFSSQGKSHITVEVAALRNHTIEYTIWIWLLFAKWICQKQKFHGITDTECWSFVRLQADVVPKKPTNFEDIAEPWLIETGNFFAFAIKSDAAPVYADGLAAALAAYHHYGNLNNLLEHVCRTGQIPDIQTDIEPGCESWCTQNLPVDTQTTRFIRGCRRGASFLPWLSAPDALLRNQNSWTG